MDPETRVQALRGAAGAKPAQWAKARRGHPECLPLREAFPCSKKAGE
jgi:hypothetical protein